MNWIGQLNVVEALAIIHILSFLMQTNAPRAAMLVSEALAIIQ